MGVTKAITGWFYMYRGNGYAADSLADAQKKLVERNQKDGFRFSSKVKYIFFAEVTTRDQKLISLKMLPPPEGEKP